MRRRMSAVVAVGVLVSGLGVTTAGATPGAPGAPAQEAGDDNYDVYVGKLDVRDLAVLRSTGLDPHEMDIATTADGLADVEVVLSDEEATDLAADGVELELKETESGESVAEVATRQAAAGYEVFRPYSGAGGLKEEFEQLAADHPDIVKLVTLGQTLNGQDIVAVKITRRANQTRDGRRPATLYTAAQHAREWITPEMNRRLAHHLVDNYGSDPAITDLVDRTELWIVPVANPDGYDWTFEPGQRLWRKNLRDNNGDGVIAPGDGVDLNRNFETKWGYDNEGSSPEFPSETYRGTAPASEPETQALDGLLGRVDFEFHINYHSAAELLLWGTGWQVQTPTPDDAIYEAMSGDDANPAIPGYDPDISAELYTTNGETTEHAHSAYGTLAFTPEMATCETASEAVPDDEWLPEDCGSGFEFPDDEELVQAEFAKNIPFAIATAQSGARPRRPGLGGRPHGARLRGRQLRRVLRRPADRGRHGPPVAGAAVDDLSRQRRLAALHVRPRVAGRRALRRRRRRLLRRVPRPGRGRPPGRHGRGAVLGHRPASRAGAERSRSPTRSPTTAGRTCSSSPTRTSPA